MLPNPDAHSLPSPLSPPSPSPTPEVVTLDNDDLHPISINPSWDFDFETYWEYFPPPFGRESIYSVRPPTPPKPRPRSPTSTGLSPPKKKVKGCDE